MTIKVSKLHAEKCVAFVLFHKTTEFPKMILKDFENQKEVYKKRMKEHSSKSNCLFLPLIAFSPGFIYSCMCVKLCKFCLQVHVICSFSILFYYFFRCVRFFVERNNFCFSLSGSFDELTS